jgi:hypothetical protein
MLVQEGPDQRQLLLPAEIIVADQGLWASQRRANFFCNFNAVAVARTNIP